MGGARSLRGAPSRRQSSPERAPSSASCSGLLPSGTARTPGLALLRRFLSTLAPRVHPHLARLLVRPVPEFRYAFRQGRDAAGLEALRSQLNARLARAGPRMQAGGWTRLLLGKEYSATRARRQSHVLAFVVPYCACVRCRVDNVTAEMGLDDVDEMLLDAQRGEGLGDPEVARGEPDAVRRRARVQKLPASDILALLGDTLEGHEFELGRVSKISTRSPKVTFAPFAKQLLACDEYCGLLSMADVATTIAEKAKEYYRVNRGKTERRFYVHGTLNRFLLDCTCVSIFPTCSRPVRPDLTPIGVLFRRQVMSVITGKLALEDSFGAFIHTETPFYIGFGQDAEGAQTIFGDGSVGQARYLGINELRSHLDFGSGDEIEINIR